MAETRSERSTIVLAAPTLAIGIALIVMAQIIHLQAASAVSAGGATAPPPLVAGLADFIVAPLLRAFGDPEPSPAAVAGGIRYAIFGSMAFGLVLVLVAGRQLFARRRR
ncbi:MAG: hypothetical protein KDC98_10225 [Planctomycetes bacterium]|nr:hypothetical protein [Planctomycetota bacterium]